MFPLPYGREKLSRTTKKQQVVIYITSAFCVVGKCLTPPTITEKKRSKEVKMFFVSHDMHQSL